MSKDTTDMPSRQQTTAGARSPSSATAHYRAALLSPKRPEDVTELKCKDNFVFRQHSSQRAHKMEEIKHREFPERSEGHHPWGTRLAWLVEYAALSLRVASSSPMWDVETTKNKIK